jgi:hypothetical protein
MNVSNEQQVVEEAVARILRATRDNDAETAPTKHSQQTDKCPDITRFAAVFKSRGRWTQDEANHIMGGCPFCQKVFAMFVTATSQEDTVTNVDTSQETQVGLPSSKSIKPSKPSKHPPRGDKSKPG